MSKLGFTRRIVNAGDPLNTVPMRALDARGFAVSRSLPMQRAREAAQWLLHGLLFATTFLTCTVFGFALYQSFSASAGLNLDYIPEGYVLLAHGDTIVFSGLWFSVPLLTILLAHEFGHYFACRYWDVKATLPFFLPSPTLLGTLGAFIRIRSPIYTRSILFDIGASGPIAGFVALVPFLVWGVAWSHREPQIASHSDIVFGVPLLLQIAEAIRFPGVPAGSILLHPIAMGAWAGLVATATNLLPVGQLDGGHIVYAMFGPRWHRVASTIFVGLLVGLGFLYRPWWVLAALLFFFGRRHPMVYDETPVDGRRRWIGVAALVIFGLSVLLAPVEVHIH